MQLTDPHRHHSRLKSTSDGTRNMFKHARRPFSKCKKMVKARDCYSVFYIATKGGLNAKKEKSFLKNDALKQFEYLCVYGEKGITAAEALKRDGRFADDLGYFELVNIDDERKTECTDIIDCLDNKKFQICFPQGADTDVAIPGQQKPPHEQNDTDQNMRAALGAILLFLILYQGEALRCNFCFSEQSDLCTPTSIQTCPAGQNACADVIFQSVSASFRQCMNMALCQGYITSPGVIAQCCSTDLCN